AALDTATIARASDGDLAAALSVLEALPQIDWPEAGRAKLTLFRRLFDIFSGCNGAAREDFDRFRIEGGDALEDHARFEALHAHLTAEDSALDDWQNWPSLYRDPRGAAVLDFAHAHEDEVAFHVFLQWIADRSLASAQASCRDAGMAIGLITDFAVGTDAKGSHPWSRQSEMLAGLSVGAPPDLFNANGQSWGIAALCPHAMRPHGYRAFIEALRATMRHAGGMRIDHAMGLSRLWVVPDGTGPADGAYIAYPSDDLFRLIALESWRNRAIVLGEDLGTVEAGFRERLHRAGILGTQVMWFERDDMGFFSSSIYSPNAMATTSTHDLPTVAGWWEGRDIADREGAGVITAEDAASERHTRGTDREAIWRTFRHDGVVNGTGAQEATAESAVEAAAHFIGRTSSPLAILPLDDALALRDQANMPGTVDEYPNWRRRYASDASKLFDDPAVERRLAAIADTRGRS
ncbi:4-alpha-glucanotransferase, partial [Parvibaculum sp.]|uniref:4-alpha-glucanotransferase n=1 Tax=Parvibaculum sp. TaxID=2024848 RepID=UPI002CCF4076